MTQTLISTKYQIVIPKEVRRQLKLTPGKRLDVHVVSDQIILSPAKKTKKMKWPQDYIKNLRGLWKNTDALEYLETERNSWDQK